MSDFIVALGLALAIEGFIYAAFPAEMHRMLESIRVQPIATLRLGGVIAFAVGVVIVWLVRL